MSKLSCTRCKMLLSSCQQKTGPHQQLFSWFLLKIQLENCAVLYLMFTLLFLCLSLLSSRITHFLLGWHTFNVCSTTLNKKKVFLFSVQKMMIIFKRCNLVKCSLIALQRFGDSLLQTSRLSSKNSRSQELFASFFLLKAKKCMWTDKLLFHQTKRDRKKREMTLTQEKVGYNRISKKPLQLTDLLIVHCSIFSEKI